jgi:Jumonji helical domain
MNIRKMGKIWRGKRGQRGKKREVENVEEGKKVEMKKGGRAAVSRKGGRGAKVKTMKRKENLGLVGGADGRKHVGKEIGKKKRAGLPRHTEMDRRGLNYIYDTEVDRFRTTLGMESFPLAGAKFNMKFKCSYDLERNLVRRDSTRTNSDNKTYKFTCGCGRTDVELLFRLYTNKSNRSVPNMQFVYHVFVRKEQFEEALLHFNYSVEFQKRTVWKRTPSEETRSNFSGVELITETVTAKGRDVKKCKESGEGRGRKDFEKEVDDGSNGDGRKVDIRHLLYSHHHVEKFLEITKINNSIGMGKGRNVGTGKKLKLEEVNLREEKLQIVRDGSLLKVENLSNGMLSLEFPIVVLDLPESIGLEISFVKGRNTSDSIGKIATIVGEGTPVTMINVQDQEELNGWSFRDLVKYFGDKYRLEAVLETERLNGEEGKGSMVKRKKKVRILNQVSFEFSGTPLGDMVKEPQIVREIDWIRNAWAGPFQHPKYSEAGSNSSQRKSRKKNIYYPMIQHYCVTSCAGAYMDFHIDVGGTSFWYYVVSGLKQFVLIQPTEENVVQYEKWAWAEGRSSIFFPDVIEDKGTIIHILVKENETIIVPSGWIHGVYTEEDSLVFGGNFLHGHSIQMQIKINGMESRVGVEEKFRCPYFDITHIFAANMYVNKLKLVKESRKEEGKISKKEVEDLAHLLDYVVCEYESITKELGEGKVRRESSANVGGIICSGKYKSVYEKPNFVDAIKYVVGEQHCTTLKEFVRKVYNSRRKVLNDMNDVMS